MRACALTLISILYPCLPMHAQKLAELIKLPKDTLIRMAMDKLEKTPDYFVDFDRVSVWSSPSAGRVDVVFDRHTRYVTRNKKCIGTVSAELVSGVAGGESTGITLDEFDQKRYYVYTATQKNHIRFVKATLMKDERYKHLLALSEKDGHLTIADNKQHFAVGIETSGSYFCNMKLDKRSGKIYDVSTTEVTLIPSGIKRIRIY